MVAALEFLALRQREGEVAFPAGRVLAGAQMLATVRAIRRLSGIC